MKLLRYRKPSINRILGITTVKRRIKRQLGILVTTSYVHSQAYKEVIDDGHPILIINASDIAKILRGQGLDHHNVDVWLEQMEQDTSEEQGIAQP